MAILDHINLDFQVLNTGNPKTLAIIDTSVWGAIEDKTSAIHIILPGSEKIKQFVFVKNKVNVFNSSNLLISNVGDYRDLADGIYRIDLIGAHGHCLHRDFLKTDKARLELDKIYASLGTENDDKTKNKKITIQNIDLLIRAAESATKIGKLKKSMMYFKKAVKKLKDYNECETCK